MRPTLKPLISTLALGLLLGGCSSYVKRADYDAALAELRARDSAIESKTDANAAALSALRSELSERFARYDKAIAEAAGRLRVDTIAYFDYDSATLRSEDTAALDDFAKVIRERHPGSLITIEGFTDAAGGSGFNQRLGLKRVEAVRDYLVSRGSLPPDSVRAVSYGESRDRQVVAGAWGEAGLPNRRAALVVDRVGS